MTLWVGFHVILIAPLLVWGCGWGWSDCLRQLWHGLFLASVQRIDCYWLLLHSTGDHFISAESAMIAESHDPSFQLV